MGLETVCYAVTYLAHRVDLGPLPNVLTVLNGSSVPPDLRLHGLSESKCASHVSPTRLVLDWG